MHTYKQTYMCSRSRTMRAKPAQRLVMIVKGISATRHKARNPPAEEPTAIAVSAMMIDNQSREAPRTAPMASREDPCDSNAMLTTKQSKEVPVTATMTSKEGPCDCNAMRTDNRSREVPVTATVPSRECHPGETRTRKRP